ncbi:4'-phosphopantetheinyl transferase family protein [Tenacibaculum xiamenense]|uniref:4'-phosphopantetheinyl transferase family protein n=1 Tax=Tenacibaculum xiamenense TaxID=1261553 RepID=UPI003893F8E6
MCVSTVALYIINDREWPSHVFEEVIEELPHDFHEKARRFRFWNDRQAFVLGKLLIKKILNDYTNLGLKDVQYTKYGKPFVPDRISFNISHSGKYVICLFSLTKSLLGIDIEKIDSKINISDFKEVLTHQESLKIMNSKDQIEAFYEIWTIKEAGMKADGRGLNIPLKEIYIDSQYVEIETTKWYYRNLFIDKEYKCHLVIDCPEFNVSVKKVKREDLTRRKLLTY